MVKCISSVQSLSPVRLFVTPWTATHQASLSITDSCNLLKLSSVELVMPFALGVRNEGGLMPPNFTL